ncbi:2-amino-4-hydroxy-6-hydroxymethyldihydropteridine diphosphokinase [Paenibacillus sp. YYML68]|uniref:2-amino-4-hydroxy-6- hydroxymethyldihydropteridine diphosphokinase n=1 Tax=Paenibacillus sp. YYML68 TaxID=2909250 RepID=UPI00248F7467|nr:2-amino-4-hydroxy-6-hydroxymethyldihydropteridine diphosphokinase [Paenibacillus sp. YYML68]
MNESDAMPREPRHLAYIGLGSNLGDREGYLLEAIRKMTARPDIDLAGQSGMYETDPVGYVEQPAFLNMVVAVRTPLSPTLLLAALQQVERQLGRRREVRWGPRTLDLDLLLYEDWEHMSDELIVPHPRMTERAFVLIPLLEVMEQVETARAGRWGEQLERVEGKEGVRLWKKTC